VRPPEGALRRAAQLLADAKRPAILAGSRVNEAGAVAELQRVAERLGAPVYCESGTSHGRLPFPCNHPLYGQGLPLWAPEIRERLSPFDALLVAGMDLFRLYIYAEPARAIPESVRVVHLDEDPWQLGKSIPVEVGLLGDTKAGLAELDELLGTMMTPAQVASAARRANHYQEEHRAAREALFRQIDTERGRRPMTAMTFMHALSRAIPPDVAVIEEAVTTTNTMLERLGALQNTDGYFGHRGWALGWGIGCALGVKLAWPDRPVMAILGEGAAMYGIQALWSAAHYRIPVTFVVANNAQYQILKVCADLLRLPPARRDRLVGLDLVNPEIDLVQLAKALGVDACRISEPDELSDRVRDSLAGNQPLLIDVPIDRSRPGRLEYG
jgi:benzoylformate decarboxylase